MVDVPKGWQLPTHDAIRVEDITQDGMLIEVPAGLLDDRDPAAAVIAEVQEETGYKIGKPQKLFDLFMSPGSVTERLHLFMAEVTKEYQTGKGGGLHEEGEDIHAKVISFADAMAMLDAGQIDNAHSLIALQWLRIHRDTLRQRWLA